MQGTIHRLIRGKGFGFIQVEDRQFFFHHTEVKGIEFKELVPGDVVAFNYVEDEQGRNPRAVEVLVVEKKEKPPRVPRGPRPAAPAAGSGDPGAAGVHVGDGSSPARSPRQPGRGFPDGGRRPQDSARGARDPGASSRGARVPRLPRRGPPRPRGAGSWTRSSPDGFVPRPPEPGPSEDGEFTEDLSGTTSSESSPAPPRRGRGVRRPERSRDDPRSQRPRAAGTPGERGEGVIRAMNPERVFGFIETPGGDIFFHRTSVRDGFESLNVGARVAFVFGEGDRGSKAEDVVAV